MLDFEAIKKIPLAEVVKRYGGVLKGHGDWLHGKCPLPAHDSKKSNTSFTVNVSKNFWQCFSDSCSQKSGKRGGDVINFVAVMEGCKEVEAAQKLADWYGIEGGKRQERTEQSPAPKPPETPVEVEPTVNKPLGFPGFKELDHGHPYFAGRGITPETAKAFGVGYFAGRSSVIKDPYRIAIPVHNAKGELVAYVGRSVEEIALPKYHFPPGFHKSFELFNLHRVEDDTVIVVEGFFSVLSLYQCGILNVVALMGRTLSDAQEELLKRFERIVLMLDGDVPGQEAAKELLQRLARNRWVNAVALPAGSQPDSLSPDELHQLFSACRVF